MDLSHLTDKQLHMLEFMGRRLEFASSRDALEGSLIEFVRAAWPVIDNSEFQSSWAIEALCEHLQAVTEGDIDRLLVNFPPRCGKTLVTIAWTIWTWCRREKSYRSGPQVRFLCGSYSHTLSLENSNRARRLIASPWFQERWGARFALRKDQNSKTQFDTDRGGSRFAASVGGSLLGIGGDIILVDDPHNLEMAESEAERETVTNWWKELNSTRLNDPKRSAVVVIMQRLHEEDVSGLILASEDDRWEHLMIPMKYEWDRHCKTCIGWEDPRGLRRDGTSLVDFADDGSRLPADLGAQSELEKRAGLLMWPQRFGKREVAALERELGPYFSAGRLQQAPSPKGGGIFNAEWWELWDDPDGKFPKPIEYVVASVDGAFTEKEENDPSAMTVWGVFTRMVPAQPNTPLYEANLQIKQHRVILLDAWRKHLPISLPQAPRISERESEASYSQRMRLQDKWGLVEWIADTCDRFKVDKLLIEAKGPGQSVVQMLQTLYGRHAWGVMGVDPKGDKVARALAVQPWFSQGLVYAPKFDWSDMVITEMSQFPKGKYDDLTDSATQALSFMRNNGLLRTDEEVYAEGVENSSYERMKPRAPLYPC